MWHTIWLLSHFSLFISVLFACFLSISFFVNPYTAFLNIFKRIILYKMQRCLGNRRFGLGSWRSISLVWATRSWSCLLRIIVESGSLDPAVSRCFNLWRNHLPQDSLVVEQRTLKLHQNTWCLQPHASIRVSNNEWVL